MRRPSAPLARAPGIRWMLGVSTTLLVVATSANGQTPDSTRRDSTSRRTRADSARIADSIAVVRELERMQAEPKTPPSQQPTGQGGPTNPRLLPDISAVGDLVGDLSPKGSTQADGDRFSVREVEIAVQAAVDPFFRGDVFLGISDLEKVSIEQA